MTGPRTDLAVGSCPPTPGGGTGIDRFGVEIAELALVLAGTSDEESVRILKEIHQDLAGTDFAVDFFVAVLRRKFELEQVSMTSRSQ